MFQNLTHSLTNLMTDSAVNKITHNSVTNSVRRGLPLAADSC